MSDESFIPYEQIEPLLEEGMTARQLAIKIIDHLKLGPGYSVTTHTSIEVPLREALKSGLYVIKTRADYVSRAQELVR